MNHAAYSKFASSTDSRPVIGQRIERLTNRLSAGWLVRIKWAALVVLAWTVVGLFQALPEMLIGFEWAPLVAKLIDAWAWALLTPAIVLIDRKLNFVQPNVVRLAAVQLVLSVPFAILHTYLTALLQYPIAAIIWSPLRDHRFAVYYFLGGWMTYCAFVGARQAFRFNNRFLTSEVELERVEKRLIESHLNALRLQLEPHFLFNTLNAISSEVASDPELAREMIEDLGALLRRSLDCQGSTEITLAQELALLDHYIAIQKRRFGQRIDFHIEVDPAMLGTMVPSMLLQPIVENAIRHGIEGRLSGGAVGVSAQRARGQLQINVIDDGVGLPPRWRMETSTGIGVRVTRERLEALYSGVGDHGFTMSRRKGGGTEVAIRIPLRRTGAEARGTAA